MGPIDGEVYHRSETGDLLGVFPVFNGVELDVRPYNGQVVHLYFIEGRARAVLAAISKALEEDSAHGPN